MKPNDIHPPSADLSNKCQTKVQKRLQTFLASARLKWRKLHTCLVCGRRKWRIFSRQKWRYEWQQSGVFWVFYPILLSARQNCRNKTHNSYYYYKFYFCRQKWRSKFRVADHTKPNIQRKIRSVETLIWTKEFLVVEGKRDRMELYLHSMGWQK